MGMLSRKLRNIEGGRLAYWCQGCDTLHQYAGQTLDLPDLPGWGKD